MARYVLYGHPESGHAYKVKLALVLLGIDHEYRHVEVFAPREQRRADWREASRFGEIPALVVDGRTIVQSDAILLHLARTTGGLGGEDLDRQAEWLFWEANRIGISLPNLRLYTRFDPPGDEGVKAWLRTRMHADLDRLDQELADKAFLTGEAVAIADLACCGYLFFADQIGLELTPWPHVTAWLDRIRALPGWAHPHELLRA